MGALRGTVAAQWLLVTAVSWSTATAAPAIVSAGLSGTVRDLSGNLLEGVEVLVAAPRAIEPVATVLSDTAGRFSIAGLLPGAYRIAALKTGYLVFVGQVDVFTTRSMDLVLQPSPRPEETARSHAASSSWALRTPRRGILRDLEPDRVAPESDRVSARPSEPLQVRVDQTLGVSTGHLDTGAEAAGLDASETRVRLDSRFDDRARVQVQACRQALGRAGGSLEEGATASERTSSVRADLAYELGPADQLELRAHYNRSGYRLGGEQAHAAGRIEDGHRSWGYDAGWARQLAGTKHMAMRLDYEDTLLSAGLVHRALAVAGTYEQMAGDRHRLEVALSALGSDPVSADQSGLGWSFWVRAEDRWQVSGPFHLVYGVGLRRGLMSLPTTWILPTLGGEWQDGGWEARARVSYDGEADQEGGTLGYDAEIVLPLVEGVQLAGSASSSPVWLRDDGFGRDTWGLDDDPLFLADGAANAREGRITLSEARGPTHTWFHLSHGRLDRALALLLPFDEEIRSPEEGAVRFVEARVGLGSTPLGADAQVEYRRVIAESRHEELDVRVRKVLLGLPVPGDWHLLLGLRFGTVESPRLDRWELDGGDPEAVVALNRRASVGVSVLF